MRMPDTVQQPSIETDKSIEYASRTFMRVEHWIYVALGAMLALVAIVSLLHAAIGGAVSVSHWSDEGVFAVIDDLLFVLMMVEIMHTVRASLDSGTLNAEPFLIVGLIACIRRVLVITLESSNTTNGTDWSKGTADLFRASMTELGVLSVLILVMVVSIFLLRRSDRAAEKNRRKGLVNQLGERI
jgi:uncharacterized membrane protein (DUF373 family)